jgi:hypothetical protein
MVAANDIRQFYYLLAITKSKPLPWVMMDPTRHDTTIKAPSLVPNYTDSSGHNMDERLGCPCKFQ